MDEISQFKAAMALAKRTMEYIADYRTPPTPHAYELFYTVSSGLNPELNRAVAGVIASKRELSAADAESLHQSFLGSAATADRINDISRKYASQLDATIDTLAAAESSAEDYGQSLDTAERELVQHGGDTAVQSVLDALIVATSQMSETNRQLTSNLTTSRTQIVQLEECLRTVRAEAGRDAVTGLTGRKRFDVLLDDILVQSDNSGEPVSLLIIDVDGFKVFNDKFGHTAGDAALKFVATHFKAHCKGKDVVARFGGDEFAILLPATRCAEAMAVAEKIRQTVHQRDLVRRSSGKRLGRISVSIGVGEYKAGEAAEDLVTRADAAMYAVKRSGGNGVCADHAPPRRASNAA